MQSQVDVAVRELSRQRLRLVDGLIFTPQTHGQESYVHVEDSRQGKFFRLGVEEYAFISLLDGQRTFTQALSQTVRTLGDRALSEEAALSICDWLIKSGLAQGAEDAGVASPANSTPWWRQANPLWCKIPLCHPAASLDHALRWCGWLYSLPAAVAWLLLCVAATLAVVNDWERFERSSHGILAPHNWLWLGATWLLLKILHEFSHALVCRRYGGDVREMGLVLVLLAPLAYVDVTSSWRFRSRWQRIHTAAAGMYIELLVAALAALWWSRTSSALASHLLYNVIFMASLTTILFNANPLMRLDGYYILSDLLGIPNLSTLGSQFVMGLVQRLLIGRSQPLPVSGAKAAWVRLYGLAAGGWRIMVSVTMLLAASVMFHGAGLILAVLALVSWVGRPAATAIQWLREEAALDRALAWRAAATAAVFAAAVVGLLVALPWFGSVTCHGVVECIDSIVVRAPTPAFVTRLVAVDGGHVAEGQMLAELRNDELATECRDLELAVQQSQARRQIHLEKNEVAAAQIETTQAVALDKRRVEKQHLLRQLTVCTPISGHVLARGLELKQGTYLAAGDELLTVADPTRRELRIAIHHEDLESIARLIGRKVAVRLPSRGACVGRLTRVAPRATNVPLHEGLCAPNGGPLAVTAETEPSDSAAFRLAEPHFIGYVELPELPGDLRSGEVGSAQFRDYERSLGQGLYAKLSRWLQQTLGTLAQASR